MVLALQLSKITHLCFAVSFSIYICPLGNYSKFGRRTKVCKQVQLIAFSCVQLFKRLLFIIHYEDLRIAIKSGSHIKSSCIARIPNFQSMLVFSYSYKSCFNTRKRFSLFFFGNPFQFFLFNLKFQFINFILKSLSF